LPRARKPELNFLDFVPCRCIECETGEDGRTTLLRPKFIGGMLGKWIQPRLRKPFYRIRLDDLGSAVWDLVNGARSAGEIASELERRFGDRVKPAHERVAAFLGELKRGKMIRFAGMP